MVVFLFIVCVLMLNILIAQVSDTYKNVKEDVHRGFEVNRASIVSRVEFNSLFNRKNNRRGNYKPYESFDDVSKVLEKWECSPLNKMNKNLQEIWNGIGSHELNIRTVQNRLSRMESCLSDIQKNLKKLN